MDLIHMSLAAGLMIIGIVLFRLAFVHRVPKRVMMILWGIVILRLVFPAYIPLPLPGIGLSVTRKQPLHAEAVTVTTTMDSGQYEDAGKLTFIIEGSGGKDWSRALTVIYLAGAAIMAVGSVYLYIRDSKLFKESLPMGEKERKHLILQMVSGEKERGYLEKVRFRVSDRTATPVTYGVFRPAIVFPKGIVWKEEKEVGFCLLHELVHIRNHDNLRKLVVHAVLCLHWFNPLVWVMYVLFNRDMELLCDETAVRKCRADRQDYALALLSLAERRAVGFRTALGFGKNAVKERIQALMSAGKSTVGGVVAAACAVILALTFFLSTQMIVAVASSNVAGAFDVAEYYTVTSGDSAAAYTVTSGDSVVTAYEGSNAEYVLEATYVGEAEGALIQEATYVDEAERAVNQGATYVGEAETAVTQEQDTELPYSFVIMLQNLAGEFEMYGLQVQFTPDDYQLYFNEKPVYFFADNQNQDGESFSGCVYARPAGSVNGDTGVETVRDENGVIIGLAELSVEESKELARAWTGQGR